jgi:cobalt-zinc-cadmium efflux system membrane fusion protein
MLLYGSWQGIKGLLCLYLIGLATLLTGCGTRQQPTATAELTVAGDRVLIATNSPQLSALARETVGVQKPSPLALAGRLIWDENVTVRVFTPFAGIIRKLFVQINEPVTKDAPLAEIQSADFVQTQADVRKAQSDFRRAERNLARLRDLFEHGAAPRKDLESAEADFATAQAEKDRAEQRVAIYGTAGTSGEQSFLLPSPLSGVLVERNVTPGQEVRPDQMLANTPQYTAPLFVVTDPSRLWIQIDATEVDLPFLRPGCDFTFTSRAFPDQVFTGRVDTVSEFIDPGTRTIKVKGSVENSRHLLKAEMFVSVNLPGQGSSEVSVPAKAVFLKGDRHYVFLEERPGQFFRQEVKTGSEQDGFVTIVTGVQPGQRVVTDGCVLLQQALK